MVHRLQRFATALTLVSTLATTSVGGQTQPTDISMDDYLGLLSRIAPAAHDGARAFLDAHRRRCGRDLTTAELRVALAAGDGDPVLMSMIRASDMHDASGLATLAGTVTCRRAKP